MKQKTHSGAKKRFKVRKSGTVMTQKASKRHLLINKSKSQKKAHSSGMPVSQTRMQALRRLMPGKISVKNNK